jgi:transcription elongation factor GreA-like protein
MPAELIRDDPSWSYPGYGRSVARRRLRLWREAPGRLVAVLTEHLSDQGTSITNAAEAIAEQLADEYPDDIVEVVEHWLSSSLEAEHYDVVTLLTGSSPVWRRLHVDLLVERLGPTLLRP